LEIAKPTSVTLKGANKVIPIAATAVTVHIAERAPVKAFFVSGGMVVVFIIGIRDITRATPHSITCIPGWTGNSKVGAEDACHVSPYGATCLAPPNPKPERKRRA